MLVILEKSVMVVKTNVGDETSLLEKKWNEGEVCGGEREEKTKPATRVRVIKQAKERALLLLQGSMPRIRSGYLILTSWPLRKAPCYDWIRSSTIPVSPQGKHPLSARSAVNTHKAPARSGFKYP